MADTRHYRFDDLRRWSTAVATGAGLPAVRAATLSARLLWFDAAGAATFGIACLPELVDRIVAKEIDPTAEGVVTAERGALATLDGQGGVPLLVLDRAASLAVEKAREMGLGLVRVHHIGRVGSGAVVAAEVAIGPYSAVVIGPEGARAVALPTAGGLPLVVDPALAVPGRGEKRPAAKSNGFAEVFEPLAAVFAPGDGWIVAACMATALEPLAEVHGRVAAATERLGQGEGRLLPDAWEKRRQAAHAKGLSLGSVPLKALLKCAERAGVPFPEPRG